MADLTLGVLSTSFKENEQRVPIHPDHLDRIPAELRPRVFWEAGYGDPFLVPDSAFSGFGGMRSREQLFQECDIILLPKPTEGDFQFFKEGQILWGWPHCVQGEPITQLGIDKKMTMIAWEAMHHWHRDGSWAHHSFHQNNELAGYSSVVHALTLAGTTGHYGRPHRKAAVISFGSTARGSVHALRGLGFGDITVYTQREVQAIVAPVPSLEYRDYSQTPNGLMAHDPVDDSQRPLADALAEYDIIVNCILQDTDRPLMFLTNEQVKGMKRGSLIIDVSCDTAMGFEFARPTSFEDPIFQVGQGVTYYAVDHTPTFFWESASYDISQALLPHLETVMAGPEAWKDSPTISKAIEIQDGQILNPKILSFQNRSADYPHLKANPVTAS